MSFEKNKRKLTKINTVQKKIKILSIDGGGIRGIIPGVILMHIEKIIQQKTSNPSAKLADYFDFFAGTSTGGILAGIYLCPDEADPTMPRFTAEQAVELYLRRGPFIFNSSAWKRFTSFGGLNEEMYSEIMLEKYLRAYFRDIKLSELVKPCLITAYEIEKRHAFFFSRNDARAFPDKDFYIRDVARATSAAPIYFKASQISAMSGKVHSFVDGGLFANNPTMCGLTDVLKLYTNDSKPLQVEDVLILSMGTGIKKTPIEYKNAREFGALGWIKPILHILSSGNNETVDYQVAQLFKNAGVEDQYLRLSPVLDTASSDLDDATPENLKALQEAGIECAEAYSKQINNMVDKIITTP
jgi:patatin-like phospholipase/acyl hydrolase